MTHPLWYGGGMKNQKTESRKQTRIPRITTERQRARVSDGRSVKRNTWERMYRIYGWLKTGEYPNCARVVAEFEVERKTALRDIAFMQDRMEMPIAYDDKRHGVQQRPLRLAGTSVAAPEPRRTLAGHSP